MADFLETIETIKAEDASAQRLYRGDGQSIRGMRRRDPRYLSRLAEAGGFLAEVIEGKRPSYHLKEAMTTSDFPLLFGDIIDRTLLGGYLEAPYSWNMVAQRRTVNDFRPTRMYFVNGGEQPLDVVPEQTEYPEKKIGEDYYTTRVAKYGRRMAFSWEAMLNDDLGALRDIPDRFGRAARRTEEKAITSIFFGLTGPDGTFFAAGHNNIVTGNPTLSIAGLQTAMTVLGSQLDPGGDPIITDMVTLWVPPALEVTARNLLNATQLWLQPGTNNNNDNTVVAQNWMTNRVKLAVGYYIPQISSTSHGNTSWVLVASPEQNRPAARLSFLRGHETPEVWIKEPNATQAGGGAEVGAMEGDFDTDTLEYRVRHVLGATLLDYRAAVASNGSGT
ncbi:MAG TPA: hypothetical protein VIP09_12180 [Dehalococcoidia bacterium]